MATLLNQHVRDHNMCEALIVSPSGVQMGMKALTMATTVQLYMAVYKSDATKASTQCIQTTIYSNILQLFQLIARYLLGVSDLF